MSSRLNRRTMSLTNGLPKPCVHVKAVAQREVTVIGHYSRCRQ